MRVKLLLVLTGGTISTVVNKDQIMGIHGNSPHLILEQYREKNGAKEDFPEFDIIEPIRMLSECSRPEYLEQIYYGILEKLRLGRDAAEIREKRGQFSGQEIPYDGIIVTHGSDTLSYTAAFLAAAFSWLSIPLVLTAADYPLSDPRSNGFRNFSDSVDFIRQKSLQGIFVVWQNQDMGPNLFPAAELLEADSCRDCFSSYSKKAFGEIRNGTCTIFREPIPVADWLQGGPFDLHMEQEVLFLRPYPGLRYDLIALENTNIRAVVHYLYHSGTACVEEPGKKEEEPYNVLAFAKRCRELGIDVYFAGFKENPGRLYETNDLLLKSGLGKPLYHVSPEMAYMEVLIAYNLSGPR